MIFQRAGNKTPDGKPEIFGSTVADQTQKTLENLMKNSRRAHVSLDESEIDPAVESE